jgi:uncharacterized protein
MLTRDLLIELIAASPRLSDLLVLAERELSREPGHDLEHALRVALGTLHLGAEAIAADEAIAAALLHDLGSLPKDHPDRSHSSELSATLALAVLEERGWQQPAQERIASAIRTHSFSRGEAPDCELGCALQDADRLEALGALGLLRTIATGVSMGAGFFDPTDPWAEHRALDDRSFTIDHFFAKLLLLPTTMLTSGGRLEAQQRATTLVGFLTALSHELGRPFGAVRLAQLQAVAAGRDAP